LFLSCSNFIAKIRLKGIYFPTKNGRIDIDIKKKIFKKRGRELLKG
jgi:hypothetical protein